MTKGYTEERVPLGAGCQYCKMCYRNGDQSLFFKEKRSDFNTSRMGYNQCRETLCTKCWKLVYDKHKKHKLMAASSRKPSSTTIAKVAR